MVHPVIADSRSGDAIDLGFDGEAGVTPDFGPVAAGMACDAAAYSDTTWRGSWQL
jgi:hypothetical protein